MKLQSMVLIVVGCSVAACAPQQMMQTNTMKLNNYWVTLDPKPSPPPGELKIMKGPQGWEKDGKKDGYVGFAQGDSGAIVFALKKETSDNTCANAGLDGDAKWVITKVQLSTASDSSQTPSSEKGDFSKAPDAWLKEAFPDVNISTGQIFPPVGGGVGSTTVIINNANNQEGYKFIYYQITASPCMGGQPVMTDPGFGNGGRK
ncbi:MAG: hypothetical protein SH820_16545 [Xanthomonadales bacterium]|nr:hypothetical protein [Xanthomonadales bacterium]